jgi:hypothetical protein
VKSKEALFDLAVRYADTERPIVSPPPFPVPTPEPGSTLQYIRERLTQEQVLPTLTVALSRQRVTDLRTEISAIIEELYATLVRNRCGIKLIDRSARDLPELATVWFGEQEEGSSISFRSTWTIGFAESCSIRCQTRRQPHA